MDSLPAEEVKAAQSCLTICDPMDFAVTSQVPLSMGFSRQEYWSGLLCPSPEDLPDPGIELGSPALQADSLPTELCHFIQACFGDIMGLVADHQSKMNLAIK